MPLDHYLSYCAIISRVYGPSACPTRDQWLIGCTKPRTKPENDFDFITERREGWGYDDNPL